MTARIQAQTHRRVRRLRIALALAYALPVAACLHAATLAEVRNEIAGIIAHPALADAAVGVCVVSIDRDEVIYRRNGALSLIPASNMKLVTVATALELLGSEAICPMGPRGPESLAELAAHILKPSDNDLAEALLRWLPAAVGRDDLTPRQLCAETWGDRDLFLHGVRWLDGSGLSRADMMTPDFTVALLRWVHEHSRWWEVFEAALPIAGVDGTLCTRMRDTPACGRVCAKTGTLTGISALSGYVRTQQGELLAFSVMMNGLSCDTQRARRLQDMMCVALVGLERTDDGAGDRCDQPAG